MDIKHGAEEIHKHNWVSGHLQGRSLAPYICVRTHNCHKITCHYWADRMDSTYCCLMASSLKNVVSPVFKDNVEEDAWVSSCPPSCPPSAPSFQWSKNLLIQLHFKPQFPFAISSLGLTAWKAAINDTHTHTHTHTHTYTLRFHVQERPVSTAARTGSECRDDSSSEVEGSRPLLAFRRKAPKKKWTQSP